MSEILEISNALIVTIGP